jgi:hypothetical protein
MSPNVEYGKEKLDVTYVLYEHLRNLHCNVREVVL